MKKHYLRVILIGCSALCHNVSFGQGENRLSGTNPDILNSLIAVAIILFILSVIVEKITQLIRKYSPFIKPQHKALRKTFLATIWRNIGKKQMDYSELDKRIEREVNSLSFMIGLAVAGIFRVDLFKMFQAADPRQVIFWNSTATITYKNTFDIILLIVSLVLTGFFLTFGSKFFHDLLDTLFQIKNLKRKMADDNTYQAESIDQFDEYIEKSYTSIIETTIQQNAAVLTAGDQTSPAMHGRMMKDGKLVDCIDIHVAGNNRGNIPYTVQAKLEKGQTITIPVNVIFGVEKPVAHALQGGTIASNNTPQFKGTICCRIKRNQDNRVGLLTCSHVMTGGSGKNFFGSLSTEQPAQVSENEAGSFFWALCNGQFDMALVGIPEGQFQYKIVPGKPRAITISDIMTTDVKVVRQEGRGISEGKIINNRVANPIAIQYSDGEFGVQNLMLLAKVTEMDDASTMQTLTAPGDSGACVFDSQNKPIGMIIAGNSKFSYAIPITEILVNAGISIIA